MKRRSTKNSQEKVEKQPIGKRLLPSNQPGPSRNVLPPPKTSSTFISRVHEPDPLGDHEEYELYDVLNTDTDIAVEMEEFKEEEYELEEYVVLDTSENSDAVPQPKRVRFEEDPFASTEKFVEAIGVATSTTTTTTANYSIVSPPMGQVGNHTFPKATSVTTPIITPTSSNTQRSKVRVVPTERLQMAPTTTVANSVSAPSVALSGLKVNSVKVLPNKSISVQYAPKFSPKTTVNVNPPIKSGAVLPSNAQQLKPVHVKVGQQNVPVTLQIQQKNPVTQAAARESPKPVTINAKPPANPLTQIQTVMQSSPVPPVPVIQQFSSIPQGFTLPSGTVIPVGQLLMNGSHILVPLVPSTVESALVQLQNSSVTVTKLNPPVKEVDEACTVDLPALDDKSSLMQEDPLATSVDQPSVQQSSVPPSPVSKIIPILNQFSSITPKDPFATSEGSSMPASNIVKVANSTLTVTRIDPSTETRSAKNTPHTAASFNTQASLQVDPLATKPVNPATNRLSNTTVTVTKIDPTKPQAGAHKSVNVGASTSARPKPPPLVKPTVTVSKIDPEKVNNRLPAVLVAAKSTPPANIPTATPVQKSASVIPCNCKAEIAKRLRLLDIRTKQMESYMNDLIDLIQPGKGFEIKPVCNRDELEQFNYDLGSSPQYLEKVKKWLDKKLTASEVHTRLVETKDLIFTPEFFLKCSWKRAARITLYSYTYIIELFKHAGSTSATKVTIIGVGNFLMRELKLAIQRQKKLSNNERNAECLTNRNERSSSEDDTDQTEKTYQNDGGQGNETQENTTNHENGKQPICATNQVNGTDPKEAACEASTTNMSHKIIEQEIEVYDDEEYLDDDDEP